MRLLKQALVADPTYSAAASAVGQCLMWRFGNGWGDIAELTTEHVRYLELALQLDKQDSDARAMLARLACLKHQYEEAFALTQRAVETNPNSAFAWNIRGWVYLYFEQPEIAIPYLERALRLSPRDPFSCDTWAGIANAYILLSQDEKAVAAARNAVDRGSRHPWAHRTLAASLALAGRKEEAYATMKKAMEIDPTFSIATYQSWNPFIHGGKRRFEGFRLAGFPER